MQVEQLEVAGRRDAQDPLVVVLYDVAELAETDAETAALAQLYREMGDTEMADALLKGNGD